MTRDFSAFTCLFLLARIHVAASLRRSSRSEDAENKVANSFQSVLIIGSSVDRYALSSNYKAFFFKREKTQHNVVQDEKRNVGIAVLQHPGVGLNGDLDAPFWNPGLAHALANKTARKPKEANWENPKEAHWRFVPTWKVIKRAPGFSRMVFGKTTPDLVVVETSLWDLAGWWQSTGHRATPERLEQWCNKDLPYLLKRVTDTFNQSRVFFRTAPLVASWNNEKWSQTDFEAMHECVMRGFSDHPHVGVIDYHKIMDGLIASTPESGLQYLWRTDGYHPTQLPSRLYLNEIFKLLEVQPLESQDASRRSLHQGEEAIVEDEDDF